MNALDVGFVHAAIRYRENVVCTVSCSGRMTLRKRESGAGGLGFGTEGIWDHARELRNAMANTIRNIELSLFLVAMRGMWRCNEPRNAKKFKDSFPLKREGRCDSSSAFVVLTIEMGRMLR
jgi:hypothetical protein